MTNEQLTETVVDLVAYKAKAQEEHIMFKQTLATLSEDLKATKSLAEDVHIMAINMQNMQKTLDETSKKVDSLTSKEFLEYKENKKLIKQNIISKLTGGLVGAVITALIWFATMYFNG